MVSTTLESPQILQQQIPPSIENTQVEEQENLQEVKKDGWFKRIVKAVWKAVKWVFVALVGVGLFITNPSFFAVGFIAGIIISDKVKMAVVRVKLVWKKQPWTVSIIVALGAFLALPITMAASALMYGANLGSRLTEYAEEKDNQETNNEVQEEERKLFQDPDAVRV